MGIGIGVTATAPTSVAPPTRLTPPGDSTVQTVPTFTGLSSGHTNTGHLIWLPDAITVSGSTWNYTQASSYPVIFMMGGQGATPTTTSTNTLGRFKTAISAGQIPPCIIVYPNTVDPDDSVEGWGMNAANGSFPLEDMLRLDLPRWLNAHTRAAHSETKRAMIGFSKGCFETLRMRAKWNTAFAAAYVCMAGPRLDADFPTEAATYNSFSAGEKTKLFGDTAAVSQTQSPIAHTAGTGLFNVYGVGAAPLLMLESDPGDATATNSMNNAQTRMTTLGVTYTAVNLDNASFTPGHNIAQYFDAWNGEATNHMGWIVTSAPTFAV